MNDRDEGTGGRRRFIASAAMTIAAAELSVLDAAQERDSREVAALVRATEWINAPRLTAAHLRGKVVLVDFWTYTCINWLRTVPYVRAWAKKYGDGLVVIGVHTPEFEFEKNITSVRREVQRRAIEYPVVIDSDYSIWRAFSNQYWPALYFLDARGRVRERHFGEGEYEKSEKTIQRMLKDAGVAGVRDGIVSVEAGGVEAGADWNNLRSPENYLGLDRTQGFASPGGAQRDRRRLYRAPSRIALNEWALAGEWTMNRAAAVNDGQGRIVSAFHARDLHLVMGPVRQEGPVRFRVSIDGRPPGPAHGVDTDESGNGMVGEQRLYQLIRQPGPITARTFEIEFLDAGVEAFAFTYG
jgi:thiol-disulfide isomerase/thioredoxin